MTRRGAAVAVGVLAAAGAALAVARALRTPPAALASAVEGRAAPAADGVQTAEIVLEAGRYRPNVVHARAGAPLRLRVLVRDRHSCATRLVVPDLGVDVPLRAGEAAEALLPAARTGTYLFTCEMRMVKGTIVIE